MVLIHERVKVSNS